MTPEVPEGTDLIAVLSEDHRRMRSLFAEFEALPQTAYVRQSKVAAQMIDLITVYGFLTREVLLPRLAALLPELEDEMASARADHRAADVVAVELWTMRPEDERFTDNAIALITRVRRHLEAQEDHLFPRLAAELDRNDRITFGADLVRARRHAPASPRVSG